MASYSRESVYSNDSNANFCVCTRQSGMKYIFHTAATSTFFFQFFLFSFIETSFGSISCKEIFSEKVQVESEQIIKSNKAWFDQTFQTTGYRNYSSFIEHILAERDFLGGKLVDMFLKEEFELSLRRRQRARSGIAKLGFLNTREVGGRSGGFSDFILERNESESKRLGMDLSEFNSLSHEMKPKYGYVRPGDGLRDTEDLVYDSVATYGGDIYVFKKESIRKRTTWTIGDSLGLPDVATWSGRYIPIEYIGFAIPFLEAGIKRTNSFQPKEHNPKLFPALENTPTGQSSYIEIQIWGKLTLLEVEKFIFTKDPPRGDFLKALTDNNIQIFDGREDPETGASSLKPWIP